MVLRELVGARVKPRIGSIEGPWQDLGRGVRHGLARSPDLLNFTVSCPLAWARGEVETYRGLASHWSEELSRWSNLLYAGNLCIAAGSWEEAMARHRAYEAALAGFGLHMSPRSAAAVGNIQAGVAPQLEFMAVPVADREDIVFPRWPCTRGDPPRP